MPQENKNRRVKPTKADTELYALSKAEIQEFIKQERRHDELSRLNEIHQQKRVWWMTMAFCGALNLALLALAFWGMTHA